MLYRITQRQFLGINSRGLGRCNTGPIKRTDSFAYRSVDTRTFATIRYYDFGWKQSFEPAPYRVSFGSTSAPCSRSSSDFFNAPARQHGSGGCSRKLERARTFGGGICYSGRRGGGYSERGRGRTSGPADLGKQHRRAIMIRYSLTETGEGRHFQLAASSARPWIWNVI